MHAWLAGAGLPRRLIALWLVVAVMAPVLAPSGAAGQSIPVEFADEVVTAIESPIALAFTPDGNLLVTTKGGQLRVVTNSDPLPAASTLALDISNKVCSGGERGLLGVAVDPNFGTGDNRFIYLYYTFKKRNGCVNRVSRFVLKVDNTVDRGSETVLITNIAADFGNHNGGDVRFGQDGHLYVAVGDNAQGGTARRLTTLNGKILRIAPDGSIPVDNPFTGSGSARCHKKGHNGHGKTCREIFAFGLRNPFRIAFDPNEDRFFINDVGESDWEEIDEGAAGADYGWNRREGPCPRGDQMPCDPAGPNVTAPIFAYSHEEAGNCRTITGGAFVPDGSGWGEKFDGGYIYADFICDKIFVLTHVGDEWTSADFRTAVGSPVSMIFGPFDGVPALFYTTFNGDGEVRVIHPDV
jgi:glucose/arabinose dehydrogenase